MVGTPVKVGETSGVDKGKGQAEEKPQPRQSPRNKQQQQMEEACSKFNEWSIRIPKLPEYIDPREEVTKPILLPPTTVYEIPIPEIMPEVHIKCHLLGRIEDLRYSDHDLTDANKFLHFRPENYLMSEHDGEV